LIEPVSVTVETRTSPENAFRVFVDKMHDYSPAAHSMGDSERTGMVIELKQGGRWYETCGDQVCEWGIVLDFEVGKHIHFAWHLNDRWAFDASRHSDILVTFAPSDQGTTVTFVHSNMEQLGDGAAEMREALAAENGWPNTMAGFVATTA